MRSIDPPTRPQGACALVLGVLILLAGASPDDEKAKVVAAPDAKNRIDERCSVELTVRSSKNAAPCRDYYLNSEEDFHEEKNFVLVISCDHGDLFKKAGT